MATKTVPVWPMRCYLMSNEYKCECDQLVGFTCKDCCIDILVSRNESLQAQVKVLEEALMFYGSTSSWWPHNGSSRYRININDREMLEGWGDSTCGGKTARAALLKLKELRGEK